MSEFIKEQLFDYICQDQLRNKLGKLPQWLGLLMKEEVARVRLLLYCLRKYEYYDYKKHDLLWYKLLYFFWRIRFNYLSSEYNVHIPIHRIGPGLRIVHLGGAIHLNCLSIGKNCTVSAGVIVGKNGSDEKRPIIGDNVDLSVGSKIIGKVRIGNNTIVAPNSVVVKDCPENSIVSGVPAKVICVNGKKVYSFY